jgi:hypothetical protein
MTSVPDWLAALGLIVPALTALGGYWLAGRNEEARDRRTAVREAAARHIARAERLEEERHEFQLDLLMRLQDVLHREVRATVEVLMQDRKNLREHGQVLLLPAETDQESFAAGIDLGRLKVRVLDDKLRGEIEALHAFTAELEVVTPLEAKAMPLEEALRHFDVATVDLGKRYLAVNETLGTLLRAELGRDPTTDVVPTGEAIDRR